MNSVQQLTKIIDDLYVSGKDVKFTKLPSAAKRNRKSMMIKNHTGKSAARRMGDFI